MFISKRQCAAQCSLKLLLLGEQSKMQIPVNICANAAKIHLFFFFFTCSADKKITMAICKMLII